MKNSQIRILIHLIFLGILVGLMMGARLGVVMLNASDAPAIATIVLVALEIILALGLAFVWEVWRRV